MKARSVKKRVFGREIFLFFLLLFSNSLPESSPAAGAAGPARTLIAQRLYFSTGTAKVLSYFLLEES